MPPLPPPQFRAYRRRSRQGCAEDRRAPSCAATAAEEADAAPPRPDRQAAESPCLFPAPRRYPRKLGITLLTGRRRRRERPVPASRLQGCTIYRQIFHGIESTRVFRCSPVTFRKRL